MSRSASVQHSDSSQLADCCCTSLMDLTVICTLPSNSFDSAADPYCGNCLHTDAWGSFHAILQGSLKQLATEAHRECCQKMALLPAGIAACPCRLPRNQQNSFATISICLQKLANMEGFKSLGKSCYSGDKYIYLTLREQCHVWSAVDCSSRRDRPRQA